MSDHEADGALPVRQVSLPREGGDVRSKIICALWFVLCFVLCVLCFVLSVLC